MVPDYSAVPAKQERPEAYSQRLLVFWSECVLWWRLKMWQGLAAQTDRAVNGPLLCRFHKQRR